MENFHYQRCVTNYLLPSVFSLVGVISETSTNWFTARGTARCYYEEKLIPNVKIVYIYYTPPLKAKTYKKKPPQKPTNKQN